MESPFLPVADKTHGHRLKSTLPRANRGGMGSDFGGDRRGQGICSVAYTDGMQIAASKCRQTELVFEGDSTMQQEWCSSPTQKIYPCDHCAPVTGVTVSPCLPRLVLPSVIAGTNFYVRAYR